MASKSERKVIQPIINHIDRKLPFLRISNHFGKQKFFSLLATSSAIKDILVALIVAIQTMKILQMKC
ncbi:hypothetical protein T10_10340 [Trichinella papuae]|uniref:Uncharacterized protein n=1 Tax=Trichinella papuae TaxID=268474 RepID=A0A0V1MX89_9BILA|nr:hypothetical protein T10_10340 [Trichinella papuae]